MQKNPNSEPKLNLIRGPAQTGQKKMSRMLIRVSCAGKTNPDKCQTRQIDRWRLEKS